MNSSKRNRANRAYDRMKGFEKKYEEWKSFLLGKSFITCFCGPYRYVCQYYSYFSSLLGAFLIVQITGVISLVCGIGLFVVLPCVSSLPVYHPYVWPFDAYVLFGWFVVLYNLYTLKVTGPGVPNRKFFQTVDGNQDYSEMFSKTVKGEYFSRFCKRCNKPKPPRAHHCNTCNKCCLRMDHHCVYVNNCVGFKNYRFFLGFLIWGMLGGFSGTLVYLSASFEFSPLHFGNYRDSPYTGFCYTWLNWMQITFVVCVLYSSLAFLFIVVHSYLTLTNQTTIELLFNKDVSMMNGRINPAAFNEFDLGIWENIYQVFWDKSIFRSVFCPWYSRSPPTDGCVFPRGKRRLELKKNIEFSKELV